MGTVDERGTGFKRLTVANWQAPDPVLDAFVRLTPDGTIQHVTGAERAHEFLAPELTQQVPLEVRRLFEVARGALLYGHFFYPLYTLGVEQLFRVADAALIHKCRQMGTSKRQRRDFQARIEYLRREGVIHPTDHRIWDVTRDLRNAVSHPDDQMILPPGQAVDLLHRLAEQINAVFGEEPAQSQSTHLCS